jgi:DNA-binding NtrC family response regulator
VRILAATNADLNALMKSGRFRTDLYYRLGVVTIILPSLEARREDIPLLVNHFLQRANARSRRSVTITKKGIELLQSMSWPGNIRELENLVERLVIFCSTGEIVTDDIEQHRNTNSGPSDGTAAPETLRQVEREQILRVLRESGGNKSLAARRLGIERKTLYQKAQRLGIDMKQ